MVTCGISGNYDRKRDKKYIKELYDTTKKLTRKCSRPKRLVRNKKTTQLLRFKGSETSEQSNLKSL